MKRKILLGFTTTNSSSLEKRFEDIDKYGIRELALFPTVYDIVQRKRLYDMLDQSAVNEIPHVHIRHDFEDWEFRYLIEKYNTQAFNVHSVPALQKLYDEYKQYNHLIYIENLASIDDSFIKAMSLTAGICIDFSHWEDAKRSGWAGYEKFEDLVRNNIIGCSHLSAVRMEAYTGKFILIGERNEEIKVEKTIFNCHRMEDISEMDYVKNYIDYLPELISIELENGFGEQLEVKKYLEEFID
jgi:hypothetical protein